MKHELQGPGPLRTLEGWGAGKFPLLPVRSVLKALHPFPHLWEAFWAVAKAFREGDRSWGQRATFSGPTWPLSLEPLTLPYFCWTPVSRAGQSWCGE